MATAPCRLPARRQRRAVAVLAAAVALGASGTLAAPVEAVIDLPGEGRAAAYLLEHDDSRPPVAAVVLFTGGNGAIGLRDKGVPRPGANFLIRTRAELRQRFGGGLVTAVFDPPAPLPDNLRLGERHAADVAALVADLRQRFGSTLRVHLAGTSRGTVSAAAAGAALGARVDGVILTSTVFNATRGGVGLAGFDYGRIQAPLLFVHHVEDLCEATPFSGTARVEGRWPLVRARGGSAPRSGPCEPWAPHGYFGVEGPVLAAMVDWMQGRTPPATVSAP